MTKSVEKIFVYGFMMFCHYCCCFDTIHMPLFDAIKYIFLTLVKRIRCRRKQAVIGRLQSGQLSFLKHKLNILIWSTNVFIIKKLPFKPFVYAINMISMAATCCNDFMIVLFQRFQANIAIFTKKKFCGKVHRAHAVNVT